MNANYAELRRLHTIPEAADILRIKKHALRRAVKMGLIPSYSCFNNRKLVAPAEVLTAMAAHAKGET